MIAAAFFFSAAAICLSRVVDCRHKVLVSTHGQKKK
jgi:hypothetical protein